MATKYLDYNGLLYFWQKIKNTFALASAVPQKTSTTPKMDGTAAIGNETAYAAGNHVHPTDTTRAPLASPAFTGTPTAPTAATGTTTTQIATTEFVANTVGAMTSGVSDVKIDNTSVVTSGVANVPFAGETQYGVVKVADDAGGGVWITIKDGSSEIEWNLAGLDVNYLLSPGTLPEATTTTKGAMSSADKRKLNSLTVTNGVIDSSCLPSFVDDVIEAYPRANQTELGSTWLATGSASGTVITPETGKIYVLMADSTSYSANSQFRWGGSAYVKLADGGVSSITNGEIDTIVAS